MHDTRTDASVVHVDADGAFRELTATYLTRHDSGLRVRGSDPETALDRLDGADCVVTDVPRNETAFLDRLRERRPDRPVVVFTGRRPDAVTDHLGRANWSYLGKRATPAQFAVLADRIRLLVEHERRGRAADRLGAATDSLREGLALVDDEGRIERVNPAFARRHGVDPEELVGIDWRRIHDADAVNRIEAAASGCDGGSLDDGRVTELPHGGFALTVSVTPDRSETNPEVA